MPPLDLTPVIVTATGARARGRSAPTRWSSSISTSGGIALALVIAHLLLLNAAGMRDREDRRHVVLLYAVHDEGRLILREEIERLRGSLDYLADLPPQ